MILSFWEGLIPYFSIKDMIDIFLVSILIYQVFVIIQGTKSFQMVLGLLLLLVLYSLGVGFKLYSLSWFLEGIFSYSVIILVILFQEPIRDSLVNLGIGKNFYNYEKTPEKNEKILGELIEVLKSFQKEKIGALIVIERNNGLRNYIQTGTFLNCEIHLDLIYAIFQSKGPLHDGALIISRGKIAAAGCYLPLSKSLHIDRKFGARRRAAQGVSEVSDALVLSVSEEDGEMNIFVGGENFSCEDINDFRLKLKQLFLKESLIDGEIRL